MSFRRSVFLVAFILFSACGIHAEEFAALQKKAKGVGDAVMKGPSLGLKPLSDMKGADRYKGKDGGLYGEGRNDPPASHLAAAKKLAKRIQPLVADGKPNDGGKIVLISVGMSNTTQEFSAFVQVANRDPEKSPRVLLVDGAQGAMEAQAWAEPEMAGGRGRPDPWAVLAQRLQQAGVTPRQVQAAWIKQARANPASLGAYPKHANELQGRLRVILHKLTETFPNLQIAYLSSRTYAGFATGPLNPEPYAYESAFAVRDLILDQIKGEAALNYDEEKGKKRAPLLLWGPYLWTDGVKGRKSDGLTWTNEDVAPDGTHPSQAGRRKVADQLLRFFKTDPTAAPWFGR